MSLHLLHHPVHTVGLFVLFQLSADSSVLSQIYMDILKKVSFAIFDINTIALYCIQYGIMVKDNVKESCNRPGVAQRVPGGLGSHIS